MKTRTLNFEGVEYPDGRASDPGRLGWMIGCPPPPDLRIRFEDDRFLRFPQIRWTLSHLRELVPTVNVARGGGAQSGLGAAPAGAAAAIDALRVVDLEGRRRSWTESLEDTYTDGIAVMHRGRLVYERYFGALRPDVPHACFSVTKSYAATLAATLIHEGLLRADRPVAHYLPEMAAGAYAEATLRQLLDMQVGVAYSENYGDSGADIWAYARAGGLRPRRTAPGGSADHLYDYLVGLGPEGGHGRAFAYKTVNTEVLCWVMARAAGLPFDQLLAQRLWSVLGCEADGYLCVDSIGTPLGGAGLCACLRDLLRFGEMMRREGEWCGRQVVPAAVVAGIRAGSDREKFAAAGYTLLSGYSYRDMWWVAHDELGVFEARGIHGQRLYVAPRAEVVIARFASHPIAGSAANDPITLPAFRALAQALRNG